MINRIIAEYLKQAKRIVIPEVGTLIRRTDANDSIIFMPLAKRDDGVLVGLLVQEEGRSEEEARKNIDEFTARLTTESHTETGFTIEGVGTFRRDDSGSIRLDATATFDLGIPHGQPTKKKTEEEPATKTDQKETPATTSEPETLHPGLTTEELSLRNELKKTLRPENKQSGSDGKPIKAQSELDKFAMLYKDEEDAIPAKSSKSNEPREETTAYNTAQETPLPAPKRKSDKITIFATIIIIASLLLIGYGVYLEYSFGESGIINGMVDSVKSLFGK